MNTSHLEISIVIVAWNSAKHLPRCLNSLRAQTIQNFEIILVDNGSTDDFADCIQEKYPDPEIRVIALEKNLGFAAANNIGARLARGKWLALLNADAFPEPDWLEKLLQAAEENPEFSFFSSRQIQANAPDLLDGAGDAYHVSGLAWRRYYNHKEQEYGNQLEEVFGACAAASLYKRDEFLAVNGFDEDYFSYFEDVDLSFRLRLAGGRCLYVPQATVYHVGSASTGRMSDFVIYHGHRNLEWTYFKNMPSLLFWLYLPLHFVMGLYFLVSFTLRGRGKAIFLAKRDAIRGIFAVLRKRRTIQKSRAITSLEIYQVMTKGVFSPYWASRQRRNTN
ncbi:MAG: glycosyltransferase family 2 protein [Anaerolineales bacterium]|nr:glycosyltransferase family 2 protein [Anaerolineales bacterium]